jgi:hypothetical protein
MAMESRGHLEILGHDRTLELIRKVTLGYTQIKLLDEQIAQVSRRLESNAGPAEMRHELLLARTELEAKLMSELANLRQVIGLIPKHAFEEKALDTLNTWLRLHVLDQGVYVLETLKPFQEFWATWRMKSLGLMSEREALDLVRQRLEERSSLPVRIDVIHTAAMINRGRNLRSEVVSVVRESEAQMEVEVRLTPTDVSQGSGESTFFLRGGTIGTLVALLPVRRPDGGPRPFVSGPFDPQDLKQLLLWRLTHPGNVPLRFRIEYDQESGALARRTGDAIRAVATDLGIRELVDVERFQVEPVPQAAFLGRWQAVTKGKIQTIDIQPPGVCVFAMSDGIEIQPTKEGAILIEEGTTRSGASVSGTWFPTLTEVVMDIKHQAEYNYFVYRGHLDTNGNLIVEQGIVYYQGSFHPSQVVPIVFQKVY